jgi:nucleotide-binding universal stress UspA family protein
VTGLRLITMNTEQPSQDLYLVVGYDGSPPSTRALDAAIRLLRGRTGRIDVVYVAHIPGIDMMSADAVGEMRSDFDEIERDLRVSAGEQLRDREERWTFERREGLIGEALIAAAKNIGEANPDAIVTIVVGSSSQALHRMVGSAAVALVRHAPVPVVVVP